MANSAPTTPKTMSSRLMTMKFMQRAAAAASTDAASPQDAAGKGRTPEKKNTPGRTDLRAFKEAADIEEAKRVAALERQVRESGETRWVLSYHRDALSEPAVQVVKTGYAGVDEIDDSGDDDDDDEPLYPVSTGRKSFGGFKNAAEREAERKRRDTASDESVSDSSSESSDAEIDLSPKKRRENGSAALKQKLKQARSNGTSRCHICGVLGHSAAICPKGAEQRKEKRKALKQLRRNDKRQKNS